MLRDPFFPRALNALRCLAITALLAYSTLASAAVIPVVENGKLVGAANVQVGALGLYSVRLVGGSCIAVFGPNCAQGRFTFDNANDASLAGQALLDQVFTSVYDDLPEFIYGCSINGCGVYVPYGLNPWVSTGTMCVNGVCTNFTSTAYMVATAHVNNFPAYFHLPDGFSPEGYPDVVQLMSGPEISYFGYNGNQPLFAVWERQDVPVSVPEPSSLATILLCLPLMAALVRRRRGRRQQALGS